MNVELTAEYTEFYGRTTIRLSIKNERNNQQIITVTYGNDNDFQELLAFEEKLAKKIFTPEEAEQIYFTILKNMQDWIIKYYLVQNTIERIEKISHIFFRSYYRS